MGRSLTAFLVIPAVVAGCGGSINQYLLTAQKGDVDQVREAVVEIGRELHAREVGGYEFGEGERQAVEYLKDVARSHRDPITRMAAISSLARLRDPGAGGIFVEALSDGSFGVRWEAAKALVVHPSPEATSVMAARLDEEPKPEVRLDLIKALIAVGDRTALKSLLEAFLDPSGRYRNNRLKVYDALKRISGEPFPFEDRTAWREYYEREFLASETPADAPETPETAPGRRASSEEEGERP